MVITDIKVRKLFDEGPMKAIVSVTFDGQLAVHDIKVINARDKFTLDSAKQALENARSQAKELDNSNKGLDSSEQQEEKTNKKCQIDNKEKRQRQEELEFEKLKYEILADLK